MKIKDVSQQTGLTKKTIRFYEVQGLLFPEKISQNGREYRTYSEENVQQLLNIATLRKARFSIDEIRRIQENPEDIPSIFQAYRDRLREEKQDLEHILSIADSIPDETLTSADVLITQMKPLTDQLPLPLVDIHPKFRYLDELEEAYTMRKKKIRMTEQEKRQHKIAAQNAAMYAAFSSQTSTSNQMGLTGKGGGFDISNAQKIAAYNLLVNNDDED